MLKFKFNVKKYLDKLKKLRAIQLHSYASFSKEVGVSDFTLRRILQSKGPHSLSMRTKRFIKEYVDKHVGELDGK